MFSEPSLQTVSGVPLFSLGYLYWELGGKLSLVNELLLSQW